MLWGGIESHLSSLAVVVPLLYPHPRPPLCTHASIVSDDLSTTVQTKQWRLSLLKSQIHVHVHVYTYMHMYNVYACHCKKEDED